MTHTAGNRKLWALAAATPLALLLGMASLYASAAEPAKPPLDKWHTGEFFDSGHFGPWDYYNPPTKWHIDVVERNHFRAKTLAFAREGKWCAYFDDLDYTLRALPNHPKALVAMAEFLKTHQPCPPKKKWEAPSAEALAYQIEKGEWEPRTPDFYFKAAINFRPQYAATYVLYGNYLLDAARFDEALAEYQEALKRDPRSAQAHYGLGTIYLKRGDFKMAKLHADKAYELGNKGAADLQKRILQAQSGSAKN